MVKINLKSNAFTHSSPPRTRVYFSALKEKGNEKQFIIITMERSVIVTAYYHNRINGSGNNKKYIGMHEIAFSTQPRGRTQEEEEKKLIPVASGLVFL